MSSRLAVLLALSVGFAAGLAAPAHAGLLPGTCPGEKLQRPFTPWLDPMKYVLAPDGGFEKGAKGWRLRGDAEVVGGNESFYVRDEDDRRALALPAGSSAMSPAMCLGIERPTMRFFARRTSGPLSLPLLRVDVLYNGLDGRLRTTALGIHTTGSSWQPSLPMPIVANLLPNLSGERAAVAFRFTAITGSWRIDDVYVDPYAKR